MCKIRTQCRAFPEDISSTLKACGLLRKMNTEDSRPTASKECCIMIVKTYKRSNNTLSPTGWTNIGEAGQKTNYSISQDYLALAS